MSIYELKADCIEPLEETTFEKLGLQERGDLQRLLREKIDVISPDTLIISEEFGDWEDSKRRIDLLGIDKSGNLVVIELKRTQDGGHMELQAIRYAAMVAAMTFEKAVEAYSTYLGDQEDARSQILEFLECEEPDESSFAQDVSIVLASAEFGKELTTAVMWLNNRGLDIRCVRLKPYRDNKRVLLDVQQVIPLPEAEEFQVRIKEKAALERTSRRAKTISAAMMERFWTGVLKRTNEQTDLMARISPSQKWRLGVSAGLSGLRLGYAIGRKALRVQLYIDTGDKGSNESIFDRLRSSREEIENRFGEELVWQRIDTKRACRISTEFEAGTIRDEKDWPAMQEQFVETLIRFEKALRPALEDLA